MKNLSYASRNISELTRAQVYLSTAQIRDLTLVGQQTALSKSELIRTAIDQFLAQRKLQEQAQVSKKARLVSLAGLWVGHDDKDDVAGYVRTMRQPRLVRNP